MLQHVGRGVDKGVLILEMPCVCVGGGVSLKNSHAGCVAGDRYNPLDSHPFIQSSWNKKAHTLSFKGTTRNIWSIFMNSVRETHHKEKTRHWKMHCMWPEQNKGASLHCSLRRPGCVKYLPTNKASGVWTNIDPTTNGGINRDISGLWFYSKTRCC